VVTHSQKSPLHKVNILARSRLRNSVRGLRALRNISPGEPFVALPRAAVIEKHEADSCPWQIAQLKAGVQDAAQVWLANIILTPKLN
jgi:hypothetical protein